MSQALRKLAGTVSKTNCIVIFINQLREKVGVMYGNPEVTTGGRALKFYASVRIDVRRIEALKDGGEVIGNRTRAKVVKNKVRAPVPGGGVRHHVRRGHLQVGRTGRPGRQAGYHHEEPAPGSPWARPRIGQGRDAAKQYLEDNPEIAADVEAADPGATSTS